MRDNFSVAKRTLHLLGPERRWRWVVLVGLALLVTGLEALGAGLIFVLMGLVTDPSDTVSLPLIGDLSGIFPQASSNELLIGAAVFVGMFFVVRGMVIVGKSYVQGRLVHNAAAQLASHLVRGYLAMPYIFHTQQNSAELVRNTFESVRSLSGQVILPIVKLVAEVTLVVGLTVVLIIVSPVATLLALVVIGPLVWLMMRYVQPRLKHLGRRAQESKKETLKAVQQALGGARDIQLRGTGDYFAAEFRRQRRELARAEYVHHAVVEVPKAMIETMLVLIIVAVFTIAVTTGGGVETVLPALGVFAYAGLRLQPSLREIVMSLNNIKYGTAVLDDLVADRARVDVALKQRAEQRAGADHPERFHGRIALESASFRYRPESVEVVRNIDLAIRRGEFVGFCGPTGGGKSTIIDLLVGLLEPTSGRVLIDGWDLSKDPAWWQQQLGVVSQTVFLTDDTIRRNIAFGLSDAEIDGAKLVSAVRRAQLSEVVDGLERGLDTVVGERGVRLSGGQRQRVAIARAFYHEPSVLILDEGTSALDSVTEQALVAAMDELKVGRTVIAVAHRLTTVKHADRIYVIEGGLVAATGTYDDLLAGNELFRELAR